MIKWIITTPCKVSEMVEEIQIQGQRQLWTKASNFSASLKTQNESNSKRIGFSGNFLAITEGRLSPLIPAYRCALPPTRVRGIWINKICVFQCAVHLIENYKCIIQWYKNSQIKKLVFQCGICILQWVEKIETGRVGYGKKTPENSVSVSPLVKHNLGLYFLTIFSLLGFCCLLFFRKVLSNEDQAQSQWNSLCIYCYWGTLILGLASFPGAAI